MNEIKINTEENLIETNIYPRLETYYLVTDNNLKNIREKNVLADIFMLITSLSWGSFFSLYIAFITNMISKEHLDVIIIYRNLFLVFSLLFSFITIWFFCSSYNEIRSVKSQTINSTLNTD